METVAAMVLATGEVSDVGRGIHGEDSRQWKGPPALGFDCRWLNLSPAAFHWQPGVISDGTPRD